MSKETEVEKKEEVAKAIVYGDKIPLGSIEEIDCLVKAGIPILQIVTHEESRFVSDVYNRVCKPQQKQLFTWSSIRGLCEFTSEVAVDEVPKKASGELAGTISINGAIAAIEAMNIECDTENKPKYKGIVYIMQDMHINLPPPVARQLRDLYQFFAYKQRTLMILGGHLAHGPGASYRGIEPSLEKQITVVNYTLPQREQIEAYVRAFVKDTDNSKITLDYDDKQYYAFSRALQGLTYTEIENNILVSSAHLKKIEVTKLLEEKKRIIAKSGILEYIDTDSNFDNIGGMDGIKDYFTHHANSFSKEAADFGVEPLKAVLVVGIPGTGKSTICKAIGKQWGLPTLRLDVGKVMSGLVGASESRMREAIATAESVAPAIVWIDEIEKALSGTKSSNQSDGGTLARVFGTLLIAMEEGLKDIVILATANDITALPPELIRRFSELFYVGLPVDSEREEIFRIHLARRKRDVADYDMKKLLEASAKFTGAEIEKSIKEAIATTYTDGKRKLQTDDLIDALKATKPLAILMAENINKTRQWAKDRARYASNLAAIEDGKQVIKTKSGELNVADSLNDMPEVKTKTKSRASNIK